MIFRLLRRVFPSRPRFDPDTDKTSTFLQEQTNESRRAITAKQRNPPPPVAEALRQIRPWWEEARDGVER